MKIEYGFAEIKVGNETYELKPTLSNIKNIGSPTDIVNSFTILQYRFAHFVMSFREAIKILQCCGLTEELTGWIVFSERSNKSLIHPGKISVGEVFILAEHCLRHGVCGIIESDDPDKEKTGEPLKRFDAHSYIVDAIDYLGVSLSEAEEMTMTQFVHLVKAKNKNAESRKTDEDGNPVKTEETQKDQEQDALALYYEKLELVEKQKEEQFGNEVKSEQSPLRKPRRNK